MELPILKTQKNLRPPRLRSINFSQNRTFLLKLPMVLPHMAKFWPLNLSIAQNTNDNDMQTVFPERIAPSAMIPS